MKSTKHILLSCLAAFSVTLCCASKAPCEDEMPLDQQLASNSPWMVYLETQILRPYLVYPGSRMYNPLLISVTYKKRDKNWLWEPLKKYEELWYKNGVAVGLRRFSNLAVQQDGVIYVKQSEHLRDSPNAPKTIGNAIARIALDAIVTNSASLRSAYVPREIFEETISELSNLGFSQISTGSTRRTVTIHLVSYPAAYDVYLRHRNMMNFE